MTAPPSFASLAAFRSRAGDVVFWAPYVAAVLRRHGLPDSDQPVAGFNVTYPTFVCGDVVVKLFGYARRWRTSHAAERAAYATLASDPTIAAPALVGEGRLFGGAGDAWPYLVTTRVPGAPWQTAGLSPAQRRAVAAEVGRQVRRVHALAPRGAVTPAAWAGVDVAEAARRCSLPPHLAAQATRYVARLGPPEPVFVHADLVANHIFVDTGRLTGIIDWGDAMVADRHIEIIQLYRDLFDCDGALLRVFLDAYGWPADVDFPRKALGYALLRQALGLAQHHTMDVFEPIAARLPLPAIGSLDELATVLFSA